MIDHLGHQLGNYTLVRLLGRGGQAEVYLGEHGNTFVNMKPHGLQGEPILLFPQRMKKKMQGDLWAR